MILFGVGVIRRFCIGKEIADYLLHCALSYCGPP